MELTADGSYVPVTAHAGGQGFRSQMAEVWLNQICADEFEAQSGGLESGVVDPLAMIGDGVAGA